MTRLRHFDNLGTARFVTFSCYRRYQLLLNTEIISVVLDELNLVRDKHALKLYGYVIMPEHVHLVIWPPDGLRLGRIIGELKSRSARRILPILRDLSDFDGDRLMALRGGELRPVFWHVRCYDHNCRTSESILTKIEYCHKNPVSRGLVDRCEDWPWSSHNWHRGREGVPLKMDPLEV